MTADSGWDDSASAWIAEQGDDGDYSRSQILDRAMLDRVLARRAGRALDVGCGEGRFCRILRRIGFDPVGIDPTAALIERARSLDPGGDYRLGRAERLDVADGSFELVVSYLSLVDIADYATAIREMARVLCDGGSLLIANLTSFATAGPAAGWIRNADGSESYPIDDYLIERSEWVSWRGITIENWHRPLSAYFGCLLDQNLRLVSYVEPAPIDDASARAARYRRVPLFHVMEWRKS